MTHPNEREHHSVSLFRPFINSHNARPSFCRSHSRSIGRAGRHETHINVVPGRFKLDLYIVSRQSRSNKGEFYPFGPALPPLGNKTLTNIAWFSLTLSIFWKVWITFRVYSGFDEMRWVVALWKNLCNTNFLIADEIWPLRLVGCVQFYNSRRPSNLKHG